MKRILLVFCLFFFSVNSSGQFIEPVTMRLSTLEEFISLFNGEPENSELFSIYPVVFKQERSRIIEGLCDVSYPLDKQLQKDLTTFSTQMCLNRYLIRWDSIRTVLTAHYKDTKGNDIPVDLTVRPSKNRVDESSLWIIERVESPMFNIGDTAVSSLPTPFDNEVGFATLLRPGTDYREKVGADYQPDYRALYLYLTANDILKLDYLSPQQYQINIGDYTLWVSYRKKPDAALAGWMITRLDKHKKTIFISKPDEP